MYWPIIIGTLKFSKLMSINFLKRLVREFEKRSEHFPLGDHFVNSHNHFPWLCIDFVGRKLMLVNFGTWNFKPQLCKSSSYLPSLRRPLCELYFSHVTKLWKYLKIPLHQRNLTRVVVFIIRLDYQPLLEKIYLYSVIAEIEATLLVFQFECYVH